MDQYFGQLDAVDKDVFTRKALLRFFWYIRDELLDAANGTNQVSGCWSNQQQWFRVAHLLSCQQQLDRIVFVLQGVEDIDRYLRLLPEQMREFSIKQKTRKPSTATVMTRCYTGDVVVVNERFQQALDLRRGKMTTDAARADFDWLKNLFRVT